MKRISAVAAVFSMAALVACSSEDSSSFGDARSEGTPTGNSSSGGSSPTGDFKNSGASGSSSGSAAGPTTGAKDDPSASPGQQTQLPQAGQLTAGVWDDNLNFDFYKKYISLSGDPATNGLPSFSLDERGQARAQWTAARSAKTELDLTILLDTTGSMGDELKYLQSEIDSIASTIAAKHPQMQPRFNLVVYRDTYDAYVTKSFEWSNAATLKTTLDQQSVDGGGDYPEQVAKGLQAATDLTWRTDANVARMVFWVADAPQHIGEEGLVHDAIAKAAQKDVHLYPVAASGADDRTEFTMRTAAQMTGGRYVFMTDDSGIGNDHAEPHIPCYLVTTFNGALVRMVESELSGTHVSPPDAEVLRKVGNPQNGTCNTQSSGSVAVY